MNRRSLLLAGLGLIPATIAARFGLLSSESAIVSVLRKRLDYLQIDDADLFAFARDAIAHRDIAPLKLRAAQALGLLRFEPRPGAHDGFATNFLRGEDRVVTQFLMGTDFFANGRDPARPVRWLGRYDARARACGSPFARPPQAVEDAA